MHQDPTDLGVSMRAPSHTESRRSWLAILTKLMEAFPPQQGTDQALESRLETYLDMLAERWRPQLGARAIQVGLLSWKFFPSIAEIEEQLRKLYPWEKADKGPYRLARPEGPMLRGPKAADFAKLLQTLKSLPGPKTYPPSSTAAEHEVLKPTAEDAAEFERRKAELLAECEAAGLKA